MENNKLIPSEPENNLDANRTIVKEIISLRGENMKQFMMSDKTIQVALYDEPVHFEKNGKWEDIDNDLYQTDAGTYQNNANSFQVEFAPNKHADTLVKIKQDGFELSWNYVPKHKEYAKARSVNDAVKIRDHKKLKLSQTEINKQKVNSFVTYHAIEPGVDLKYILRAKEVKEYIVLNKKTECESFTFHYKTADLKAKLDESGSIRFYNPKDHKDVYTIHRGFMKDAAGNMSNILSYALEEVADGYHVIVKTDQTWLSDEARIYPIEIDPPIQASQDYFKNEHAYVHSARPDYNNHLAAELPVGSIPEGDTFIAYLKFTGFPTLTAQDYIVDAKLGLYCLDDYYDGTKTTTINVRRITSWWDSNHVTYNTRPSTYGEVEDYCKVKDIRKWYTWNITNMVRDWYKTGNPNENYGLELTGQEDGNVGHKRFLSSDYAAIADGGCPIVYFTYFSTKGLESCYTYYEQDIGRSGTCYVQHLTGIFNHVYGDVTTNTRIPLTVNHVFSSGDGTNIGFGTGMRLNISQTCIDLSKGVGLTDIDKQIYKMDNRYRYKYTDGDGTVIYFYKDDDGVYKDELGIGLKISLDEYGDIFVKDKNEFSYGFLPEGNGKLYEYFDSARNTVRVVWDGDYPVKVHDYNGNEVLLHYNANKLLDSITDPSGRVTRYEYLGERLLKIIRPDGTFTHYGFEYGRMAYVHDSETETCIYAYTDKGKIISIRKFLKSDVNPGYVVIYDDHKGAGAYFDYKPYSTIVRTAGVDDILGNGDDIATEYQFDTFGRTTTVHSYRVDGSADYGTQKYSLTTNTKTNSENNNKVTQIHTGGGYVNNLLENASFEYNGNGWGIEAWGAEDKVISTTYPTDNQYFGKKCLKKTVDFTNNCKIFNSQHFQNTNHVMEGKFTLSSYIKTEHVESENGGAFIGAYVWNQDNTEEYFHTDFITGTSVAEVENGWSRLSITFEITNKAKGFCIMLGLDSAKGTVYFDGVQLERGTIANPFNMVENSSFERGTSYWELKNMNSADGIVSDGCNGNGFRIQNDSNGYKELLQTIPVQGNKNDTYIASVKLKTKSCPLENGKRCDLTLGVRYEDDTIRWVTENANVSIWGEWQYVSNAIVLADPKDNNKVPKEIVVNLNYFLNQNWVVFDNVQLIKDFSQSYQYDSKGNLVTTNDYVNEQGSIKYNEYDKVLRMFSPGVGNYYYGYLSSGNTKHLARLISGNGLTYNLNYNDKGDQTHVRVEGNMPSSNGVFYIKNVNTGKYLDVPNSEYHDGVQIINHILNQGVNQKWKLESAGNDLYILRCAGDNTKVLDVYDKQNQNGTKIIIYNNNGGDNQKFKFEQNDDGSYSIIPNCAQDKCLDIEVASNNLQIWDNVHSDNQKFILEPVGDNSAGPYYMEASAEYDKVGRVISTTDILGNVTTNTYDDKRGTLLTTTAHGQTVHYTYDANNDRTLSVMTQNGDKTITNSYSYTKGALSSISHNDTTFHFEEDLLQCTSTVKVGSRVLSTKKFGYEEGQLRSLTYGNGDKVEYVYNDVGQTAAKKYNDVVDFAWEYDYMGVSKEIDNVNHVNHTFHYDSLGRVVRHDSTQGLKSHVTYDNMNRITKYAYSIPGESVNTTFNYDKRINVMKGQTNSRFSTENKFDSLNRLTEEILTAGNLKVSHHYSYVNRGGSKSDNLVRLFTVSANDKSKVLQYSYNDKGYIIGVFDHSDSMQTKEYTYDDTNQLITESCEQSFGEIVRQVVTTYTYDVGGNITSKTVDGVTTTWLYEDDEWHDLLTNFDGQAITYDEIGNPLTYRDGMSFTWERGRQLKQVTKADETIAYKYNSAGLRTQKTSSINGTTTFILEGNRILSSTNGSETIYFYYNEKDRVVAMRVNDQMYVYERNVQGDIIGLLDSAGNYVVKYSYNAWGLPVEVKDGSGADVSADKSHLANKNPFRYRGYYYDVETGLYYLQSRYYDPVTCRFINGDEYVQTAQGIYDKNVFAYCENEPVNRIDSEGMFWIIGAIVGACFGALIGGVSKYISNKIDGKDWNEGMIEAVVGGAVSGVIAGGTGNVVAAHYAGAAAASVTEETISYAKGDKNLNWDNINRSALKVTEDTIANGTVNYLVDRAIPNIKVQSIMKQPVKSSMKRAVQNELKQAPRNIITNTISNTISNKFVNPSNSNNKPYNPFESLIQFGNMLFGKPNIGLLWR